MNNALKSAIPSGAGYIAGALTAGVMFLGNHVLHLGFMQGQVETALTPFASLLAASVFHKEAKPVSTVTSTLVLDAEKIAQSIADKVHISLPQSMAVSIDGKTVVSTTIPEAPAVAVKADAPAPAPAAAPAAVAKPAAAPAPAPAPAGLVTPASSEAPHITQ